MAPVLFPATTAWYDSLPARKLDAFVGCEANSRLPRKIEQAFPTLSTLPGLPRAWRYALSGQGFAQEWVPEARLVLQYLVLRDAFFTDDASFLQVTKARIKESFQTPLMRPMMAVMSPHLLILGASIRWAQYHRGTQLKVASKSMNTLAGTLHFPPGLYPPLMVADTQIAVQASIEMTGKVAYIHAQVHTPGICELTGRWE